MSCAQTAEPHRPTEHPTEYPREKQKSPGPKPGDEAHVPKPQ